jgi:hypothetical protein
MPGSGHFRAPLSKGIEIINGLRGHTSGYAVPHYLIDALLAALTSIGLRSTTAIVAGELESHLKLRIKLKISLRNNLR